MPSASGYVLSCDGGCVANALDMAQSCPVCSFVVRSSYGFHDVDHLAADRTSLTGGQIAIIALLQVDADLPWCTCAILR